MNPSELHPKSKLFVQVSTEKVITLAEILDGFQYSMGDKLLGKHTREFLELSVGNAIFFKGTLIRRIR